MKKTQKELGAVHLRIEGLDKERFKELVMGHTVYNDSIVDELNKERYGLIENSLFYEDSFRWVSTNNIDDGSKLITLDELETLLKGERTAEVIQSEIDALQKELDELNKIKVGDVVLTDRKSIVIKDFMFSIT